MSTQDEFAPESPKELAQRIQREIYENIDKLYLSRGKDIVVVFGYTGSGKSTTLNWLAGKELVVGKYGKIKLADETDESAMEIGNSYGAMTDRLHYIEIDGHVFFDLPGFRDTDGMACDLINVAFIKAILENANSVKVMFIVSEDEVTASKGELLKSLLTGVGKMFDKEGKILMDSSLFILTKSKMIDVEELREYLMDKIPPKYFQLLNTWIGNRMLFQFKAPMYQRISQDGRTEILRALSRPGQKVSHVDVGALYPCDVDAELKRIFGGIFVEELDLFMPKPDEEKPSSLLDAIFIVKGNPETDGYCREFWDRFIEHVETVDAVKILKPLSEKVFGKALEDFQNIKSGWVDPTVAGWESQFEVLSRKIQDEIVSRIQDICEEQVRKQRDQYSHGGESDIKSGEERLQSLKKALYVDTSLAFLDAVMKDQKIQAIVDRDPDFTRPLLEKVVEDFSKSELVKIIEDFSKSEPVKFRERMKEFLLKIELVESSISRLKSEMKMKETGEAVKRLSDQVEEDKKEIEVLMMEIERLKADVEKQKKETAKLNQRLIDAKEATQ